MTSPQSLDSNALYHAVLDAWNARDASRFAELFFDHAQLTGFDGSMLEGRMVPPGERDINPDLNAVQSMVAVQRAGRWRIAAFSNTPASFHDRPAARDRLTAELRALAEAQASTLPRR